MDIEETNEGEDSEERYEDSELNGEESVGESLFGSDVDSGNGEDSFFGLDVDSEDDDDLAPVRRSGRGTDAHEAAFGNGISVELRNDVDALRDDDPELSHFSLDRDARSLNKEAFELLGRYIANNHHLQNFDIEGVRLSDSRGASLFLGLKGSNTMREFNVSKTGIGINSCRSMVPFLKNSPNVTELGFHDEENFDSECLDLLAEALTQVTKLFLDECRIQNISSLGNLTQLVKLDLDCNEIGNAGCDVISTLLLNKQCHLKNLYLQSNDIGCEGVEKIANCLKGNKTLRDLRLKGNGISESGARSFLKLLNDISSIETTLKSNSTLKILELPRPPYCSLLLAGILEYVNNALSINRGGGEAVGKEKVRLNQLSSETRETLCEYQGVEYSYGVIFADVEAVVLPDLLALVGQLHGQTDFYRLLLSKSSDLISLSDRQKMLKDSMKQVKSMFEKLSWKYSNATFIFAQQSSGLASKFFELSERLTLTKSMESNKARRETSPSPDTHQRKKIEEDVKQMGVDAQNFLNKSAALTDKINWMMDDLCRDFPGLSGTKRKRRSSSF